MKKILSLVCMLVLTMTSAMADDATFTQVFSVDFTTMTSVTPAYGSEKVSSINDGAWRDAYNLEGVNENIVFRKVYSGTTDIAWGITKGWGIRTTKGEKNVSFGIVDVKTGEQITIIVGAGQSITIPEKYKDVVSETSSTKDDKNNTTYIYNVTSNYEVAGFIIPSAGKYIRSITLSRPASAQIAITDASGYATYVTNYAMNFANTDIKAYTVSAINSAEGVITLKEVTEAPANTPLIVKGKTANIPVADNAAEISGNKLLFKTESYTIKDNDDYDYYVLAHPDGQEVGFYKVQAGTKIDAYKSHFRIKKSTANAKSFAVKEPGTVNGINEVKSETTNVKNQVAYNLAGQRVAPTAKGIVIINGKKYLNK